MKKMSMTAPTVAVSTMLTTSWRSNCVFQAPGSAEPALDPLDLLARQQWVERHFR